MVPGSALLSQQAVAQVRKAAVHSPIRGELEALVTVLDDVLEK